MFCAGNYSRVYFLTNYFQLQLFSFNLANVFAVSAGKIHVDACFCI